MKLILGLEDWGLTENGLLALANLATVRFPVEYPSYKLVVKLVVAYPPAERRRRVSALMRQAYKALKACLPEVAFEKLGSHIRPLGIRMRLPLSQLPALLNQDGVSSVWIEEVDALARIEAVAESHFWSIKARFDLSAAGVSEARLRPDAPRVAHALSMLLPLPKATVAPG